MQVTIFVSSKFPFAKLRSEKKFGRRSSYRTLSKDAETAVRKCSSKYVILKFRDIYKKMFVLEYLFNDLKACNF